MKHLESYCLKVGVPMPEFRRTTVRDVGRHQGQMMNGAVARAVFEEWCVYHHEDISEQTQAHELAHLLTDRDGHQGDSIIHGPLFQERLLEIQNHIRDENRKEIRARKA